MTNRSSLRNRLRVVAILIAVSLACGVAVFGLSRVSSRKAAIASFDVKREDFVDSIQFRGEVKAMKSVTISAPANAGKLQILKMASNGAQVKKGDVVVEFDRSKTEQNMKQYGSVLKSAQAEIEQARAQARLVEEDDVTGVSKAQYDVVVAKLDASKQEIVSKIEGAEASIKVTDAEQKLKETEAKLKSDRAVNKAAIDAKIEASKKARYDMDRAEQALNTMILTAPSGGNIDLTTVWHGGGVSAFKPGERVWAGAPIAELPDASSLRVSARVDEAERGRLAAHQRATVLLDAISDRQFSGELEQIGTIATTDFTGGWPIPRNFDLRIALDQSDPRLRPGMTSQITVVVDRIPNAISIPLQASFQRSGRTVAYVAEGTKYKERPIEVGLRNRDRVLVTAGLEPGDRVALQDPFAKQ